MTNSNFEDGQFYDLSLSDLVPSENQPRKFFCNEAHEQLKDSIKKNDMLDPILFTVIGTNKVILSGERRWRAMKDLGNDMVICRYIANPTPSLPLIANLQREELLPIERSEVLQCLKEEYGYTHEELAKIISKSVSTVSEIIKINCLPEDIKVECRRSKKYVHSRLLQVANAQSERAMRSLFNAYKNELDGKPKKTRPKQKAGIISIANRLDCLVKDMENIEQKIIEHGELDLLRNKIEKFKSVANKLLNFEELGASEIRNRNDSNVENMNIDDQRAEPNHSDEAPTVFTDLDQVNENNLQEKQDVSITVCSSEFRSDDDKELAAALNAHENDGETPDNCVHQALERFFSNHRNMGSVNEHA